MKLPASQIRVGDLIDLQDDPYADPNNAERFGLELQEVVSVEDEGPCIAIGFEGFDIVGFPRDHSLFLVLRQHS